MSTLNGGSYKKKPAIVALELEKPNPENYGATVQQVVKENETGYLLALETKIDSVQNCDVVFVVSLLIKEAP